jgi:glycosyltransferase involved in cell wall biosynthesis
VLIEASEAYRNNTGIGRFSRALIDHLPPALDLAFSPQDYAHRTHMSGQRSLWDRGQNFAGHFYLTQVKPLRRVQQMRPDVFHSLSFFNPLLVRGVPLVSTFFDLAYIDQPQQTDRFWGTYGRRMMPIFAERSAAIITTSAVSRQKIIGYFGVPATEVHNVSAGVDARFHPVMDEAALAAIRKVYSLHGKFVLYVGAWHRSKNLPTLLEAFRQVNDATLVITGRPHNDEQAQLPDLARRMGANVQFIGYVRDEDLPGLYTLASVVVQPSLYEGFGLPVVEAMACGTPVIVSDIPVLREIAGDAAPNFPPDDPAALRELLGRLLHDEGVNLTWRHKALRRAADFDWTHTAQAVVDVWRQVAST